MQVSYNDIITASVARGLANYIQEVQTLVNNNAKFYACLPTVIIEYGYDTPSKAMAQQIIEHG